MDEFDRQYDILMGRLAEVEPPAEIWYALERACDRAKVTPTDLSEARRILRAWGYGELC